MNNKKLSRSETDVMLGGVCGGLAEYVNIDVSIVRIIFVLLTLFVGGSGILLYVILWIIVPPESQIKQKSEPKESEPKKTTKTIAKKK